jgi:hypothetical protein
VTNATHHSQMVYPSARDPVRDTALNVTVVLQTAQKLFTRTMVKWE